MTLAGWERAGLEGVQKAVLERATRYREEVLVTSPPSTEGNLPLTWRVMGNSACGATWEVVKNLYQYQQ
jgi:hypothetical protein